MAYTVGHIAEIDGLYAAIAAPRTEPAPTVHPVPRKPYRSPRDWLPADQRGNFGHGYATALNWLPPTTSLDEALIAAAKQQSDLAHRIRISIGRAVYMPDLAASIGVHVDTVRDMLNGSRHANLALVSALSNAVGLNVRIAAHQQPPAESDPNA